MAIQRRTTGRLTMAEKMKATKMGINRPASLASVTLLLIVTAVGVFIWMAATSWKDTTGIAVGIIFFIMAAVQCAVAFFWWRGMKRDILPGSEDGRSFDPVETGVVPLEEFVGTEKGV